MGNLGLLFYKDYFRNLEFHQDEKGDFVPKLKEQETRNTVKSLFGANIENFKPPQINCAVHTFELATIYPGLLIGSGYNHEIGQQKDELKLGFFFDHTTGLPCIPGSSVKGVLRDASEKDDGKYLLSVFMEIGDDELKNTLPEKEAVEIFVRKDGEKFSRFVSTIFEGKRDKENFLPLKERDIFFDAFPIKSKNNNKIFLGNDYITPHKHSKDPKLDPFTNPNPIQFMKILPQVIFQFNFRFTNTCVPDKIKRELFKQILLDLGVGAKTNVGYGQFI